MNTEVTWRRRGSRVVAAVVASALVLAGALAYTWQQSAGRDSPSSDNGPVTTEPPSPKAPTITITAGEPVRGSAVTVTVQGLVEVRGQEVDVTIKTSGPIHTTSGGDRVGYSGVASALVDDGGTAVIDFQVPNALSGEDDVIPLVPGEPYLLEISSRDPSGGDPEAIPFQVVPAERNKPYPVTARRGARECGAPPVEIDFDGSEWIPDDLEHFPSATQTFPGTFTILTERSGEFVASDGTTTFTQAATGYSC